MIRRCPRSSSVDLCARLFAGFPILMLKLQTEGILGASPSQVQLRVVSPRTNRFLHQTGHLYSFYRTSALSRVVYTSTRGVAFIAIGRCHVPDLYSTDSAPHRKPGSSSRKSARMRKSASRAVIHTCVDWNTGRMDVFRDLDFEVPEQLHDAVITALASKFPAATKEQFSEEEAHGRVQQLLDILRDAAHDEGFRPHRSFHEHETTDSHGKRPDFVLTRSVDHQPGPFANLSCIEAKGLEDLIRDAVAQTVKRAFLQVSETSGQIQHCLAVATDSQRFVFVRVGFENRSKFSVRPKNEVSPPLPLADARVIETSSSCCVTPTSLIMDCQLLLEFQVRHAKST